MQAQGLNHGFPTFCGKGPHRVLWTCSRAALGKITVTCEPQCVNYCRISVVYPRFASVGAGQPGYDAIADPWCKVEVTTFALLKVTRHLFTQIVILLL